MSHLVPFDWPFMFTTGQHLSDLNVASMEDAWYEMEGSYEVYGIGRYRFVLPHCITALHICIVLLAKKKGRSLSDSGIDLLLKDLGMPVQLIDSFKEIDSAERLYIQPIGQDDAESTATVLSKTLEVFEWLRGEIGQE